MGLNSALEKWSISCAGGGSMTHKAGLRSGTPPGYKISPGWTDSCGYHTGLISILADSLTETFSGLRRILLHLSRFQTRQNYTIVRHSSTLRCLRKESRNFKWFKMQQPGCLSKSKEEKTHSKCWWPTYFQIHLKVLVLNFKALNSQSPG